MEAIHFYSAIFSISIAVLSSSIHAALTVPAGLNPGDAYRVIFVSSTPINGTSSITADYDAHIQGVADTAGIGGTLEWIAIVSTPTESAIDHVTNFVAANPNIPIYNQAGEMLVSVTNNLWNGLSTAVLYDEFGAVGHSGMWTGTDVDGQALINRELGTSAPVIGSSSSNTSVWLNWMLTFSSLELHTLYGLSATIIVPGGPSALADGDINADGQVNTADVILAVEIVFGQLMPDPNQLIHADVAPLVSGTPDPDGLINTGDVLVILRKSLGLVIF